MLPQAWLNKILFARWVFPLCLFQFGIEVRPRLCIFVYLFAISLTFQLNCCRKVDEKHDLQRLLWHLEAKYASFTSILQQSQSIVWKEAQSKREQGRVTRLLHMKLKQKPGQTSDPASTLHDA